MSERCPPQHGGEVVEPASGAGRPGWLVPLLAILALVIVGLVVWAVARDGGRNDDETAIVVGMSPTEIRELQSVLTQLGYDDGPTNGVYNQKAVDAVKGLQRDLGVTVDGIIGPETMAAIQAQLGGSPTSRGW